MLKIMKIPPPNILNQLWTSHLPISPITILLIKDREKLRGLGSRRCVPHPRVTSKLSEKARSKFSHNIILKRHPSPPSIRKRKINMYTSHDEEVGITIYLAESISLNKPESPEINHHIHLPNRPILTCRRSQTLKPPNVSSLQTLDHLIQVILEPPLTPPQKNLLWFFTIFFQTLIWIFRKAKKKTGIELRIKLIRIHHPPKDTYLCLQEWSLLYIRIIKRSHIKDKWGFAPTGRPKYLKGGESYW